MLMQAERRGGGTAPTPSQPGAGKGWLSAPRPGHFTPEKSPVPIAQEAGWASGPVWKGTENLATTGLRFSDRSACNKSLYRLLSPGRHFLYWYRMDKICRYLRQQDSLKFRDLFYSLKGGTSQTRV
jgi:hypothetical protein